MCSILYLYTSITFSYVYLRPFTSQSARILMNEIDRNAIIIINIRYLFVTHPPSPPVVEMRFDCTTTCLDEHPFHHTYHGTYILGRNCGRKSAHAVSSKEGKAQSGCVCVIHFF